MEQKYYSEDIIKDSPYRLEYRDSITAFLEKENEKRKAQRRAFFNPADYKADPEKFKKLYLDTVGFPLNTECNEKLQLLQKSFVAKDGNVNIYRMQFALLGIRFYGIYFEQTENPEEAPFVFGLHGGEGTPETVGSIYDNSANYFHLARRLTDRGCSVFSPQLLLWNMNQYGAPYNRTDVDNKLNMMGGSITALETLLMSKTLDYFLENERVNKTRIGVAGLSYGGQFSMDLAAYDERIRACCAHCFFNDRFVYSEGDWSYFNSLNTLCDAEKSAVICPRALCITVGKNDDIFEVQHSLEEGEYAKCFYEEFGVPEKYDFYAFEGGHQTDESDRWIDFLMKYI